MRTHAEIDGALAVGRTGVLVPPGVDPRTWHYREFYGLADPPLGAGLVVGNCQAESLRLVLDHVDTPTVRIPPVHELTIDDIPHLERLLQGASFVVMQPVRDDYRGLPVGTAQLRGRMRAGVRTLIVPVVRYAGLHPFQLSIRMGGAVEDPPLVPYHDVRGLARAGGLSIDEELPPYAVRAIATASVHELQKREFTSGAVAVSDVFVRPDFELMRTINHPGNPVWMTLGTRVLDALDAAHGPTDPGRPLLASVQAPRESWVVDAWGLDDEPRDHWVVDGEIVTADDVRAAHAQWYRDRPEFVRDALDRERATLRLWGAR